MNLGFLLLNSGRKECVYEFVGNRGSKKQILVIDAQASDCGVS